MSKNRTSLPEVYLGAVIAFAAGCGGGGGGGGTTAAAPGYGGVAASPPDGSTSAGSTTPGGSTSGGGGTSAPSASGQGAPAAVSGSSPASSGLTSSLVPAISDRAPGPTGAPPASASFMTEQEEVSWINSLGFNVTLADLRASYSRFQVTPIDPNVSVLWGTESDMLRNYFRLYQRTGYRGFYDQAKIWRDFFVGTYSHDNKGHNNIEYSHVYLMGLVDWYLAYKEPETLAAIDRIIDFLKTVVKDYRETRGTARPLQCLAYYNEKIGIRRGECDTMLQQFIDGIDHAPHTKGFLTMRFAASLGSLAVPNTPAGVDLRKLFPEDASLFDGPDTYPIANKQGCGLYQDCMLMHALRVAARYRQEPRLADLAGQLAASWEPLIDHPAWDTTGATNLGCPYYLLPEAPNLRAFIAFENNSMLYTTQFAPFCTDPGVKRALSRQALLRQYKGFAKIQPSELGGKPRFYPWETWQAGYFLLQN